MGYLRLIGAWLLENGKNKIGGPGLTVEVDESAFGRKGRKIRTRWLVGGFCRETKEIFLVHVPNRKAYTLRRVLYTHIHSGSIVLTDCWKGYNLNGLGFGV